MLFRAPHFYFSDQAVNIISLKIYKTTNKYEQALEQQINCLSVDLKVILEEN